ncbi:MAG: MBL fold metallo-hydrolase RNA specificity domain-containing protein, partial [Terriglobia bacterium]
GQFREKDGDDQLVHLGDETFIWGPLRRKILEEQDRYLIYTSNGPLTLLQLLETEGPKTKGTFIYGKAEPFNEEMEFSFARLRNWLDLCGLKLAYAHTSGHADIQSLKRFVSAADPGLLMPIHTESPESFKGLARKVVLPELGQAHDV